MKQHQIDYQKRKDKIREYQKIRRSDPTTRKLDLMRVIKCRAKAKGLEFNLAPDDLDWPTHCPLLEIPICYTNSKNLGNSPSVDRKDSSKGYTKDNCWVISNKANTMKSNSTIEEIKLLAKNIDKLITN